MNDNILDLEKYLSNSKSVWIPIKKATSQVKFNFPSGATHFKIYPTLQNANGNFFALIVALTYFEKSTNPIFVQRFQLDKNSALGPWEVFIPGKKPVEQLEKIVLEKYQAMRIDGYQRVAPGVNL